MFVESLDILYIILAIAVALLTIFFSVVLIYAILILRDVNKASEAVKESAERVNKMIVTPLKMTRDLLHYAKPVVDVANEKILHRRDKDEQEEKPKKKKGRKKK